MQVICPYEPEPHLKTATSLTEHMPVEVKFIELGPDPQAYWRLLSRMFYAEVAFINVEHDIEVHEGVYPAFNYCPEPWCTFAYPCSRVTPELLMAPGRGLPPQFALKMNPGLDHYVYTALGCCRFREPLLRDCRELVVRLGERTDGAHVPEHMVDQARHWKGLDAHMSSALRQRGYEPHVHGTVLHHHDYPAGCACGDDACVAV